MNEELRRLPPSSKWQMPTITSQKIITDQIDQQLGLLTKLIIKIEGKGHSIKTQEVSSPARPFIKEPQLVKDI